MQNFEILLTSPRYELGNTSRIIYLTTDNMQMNSDLCTK